MSIAERLRRVEQILAEAIAFGDSHDACVQALPLVQDARRELATHGVPRRRDARLTAEPIGDSIVEVAKALPGMRATT